MGGTPYRLHALVRDRVMADKHDRRKENAMMIQELTGILYMFGFTLLRFAVPVLVTWTLGSLLQRVVSST
jgi:hypothetical protein